MDLIAMEYDAAQEAFKLLYEQLGVRRDASADYARLKDGEDVFLYPDTYVWLHRNGLVIVDPNQRIEDSIVGILNKTKS